MLNKSTKRLLALVLSTVMLLSAVPFGSVSAYADTEISDDTVNIDSNDQPLDNLTRKVRPSLLEQMEQVNDDEKISVLIWFIDTVINKDVSLEVKERTGIDSALIHTVTDEEYNEELANWTQASEDYINRFNNKEEAKKREIRNRVIEKKALAYRKAANAIKCEYYHEQNEKFLNELDIDYSEQDIILDGADFQIPCYAINLSKADIKKAAESENVTAIFPYEDETMVPADTEPPIDTPIEDDRPVPPKDTPIEDEPFNKKYAYTDALNKHINKISDTNTYVPVRISLNYDPLVVPALSLDADIPSENEYDKVTPDIISVMERAVKDFNIAQYKPAFKSGENNCIFVKLPVNVLDSISSSFDFPANSIDYWDQVHRDLNIYRSYDSADALRILRASIGLEDWNYSMYYDLDQDGVVDSYDSLTALRASVKLTEVSFGVDHLYPLYDVEKYGLIEENV